MNCKKLILAAAMFGVASAASAVPVLPAGPIYIKYDNLEQISVSNSITSVGQPAGLLEGNWGVFRVSTASTGNINPPNNPFFFNPNPGSFFQDGPAGEITGMFYGLTNIPCAPGSGAICSTGGFMDLYFDPTPNSDNTTALPSDRTSFNTFTGYTDGILLAHLDFANGISINPLVNVSGTALPNATDFTGFADSYLNVDTSLVGAWTNQLNGNYFPTAFGPRDVRLRSIYNGPDVAWNGPGDIIGVQSSDPARAFSVVPEPSALSLLALALIGLGFVRRRTN